MQVDLRLPYKIELYKEFFTVQRDYAEDMTVVAVAKKNNRELAERQFLELIRLNAQPGGIFPKPPAPLVSAGTIADQLAGHVPLPQAKPKPAPVTPKAFPARALTKGWTPIA